MKIELLKKEVLINADLSPVTEADIAILANRIKKVTHKELSRITLSRLYGFNEARFGPSLFALQVLANFCGYESWEKFCEGPPLEYTTGNSEIA
ncbi:hypothetical protein MTO98_33980 [Mucilaginibacter sp. SMC90]|uniref:hypothetical protein n=1 Tax=Mucilaginibacter sp. SMC90 TaxID=2929803 RepID=UPI001FB4E862|nr:hypothetical protein [Mucilaginibacter sp. SMC90]UOE49406.1 hypothetical protein MTO98_33980 [Mucilaginibacter sp. SMC90]